MWKVEADNKLRIDGAVIGTLQDQAPYLFSRMEAKAQLMVVSFYQNHLVVTRLPLFGILIVFTLIRTQQRAL